MPLSRKGTYLQGAETMPVIIYIAGAGRSGSTLLDILLGNHPAVFGAGELAGFFLEWSRGGRCTCGQSYPECSLWGQVIERLETTFSGLTSFEAEKVSRGVESFLGGQGSGGAGEHPYGHRQGNLPPLGGRGGGANGREFYGELWRTVMGSISQGSGKNIIVDSSKSSRPVLRRAAALSKLGGFDLKVVHLVRDPRALMWSALRGSNRLLEQGQRVMFHGGLYRALMGWGIANLSVHLTQATNPQLKVRRLRYEDLVGDPAQTLRALGSFLALDLEPVVELAVNQRPLTPGHGVGGNRMRRQGAVRLSPDEEWKRALPKRARMLAPLAWPLAHKYGYDVLREA